MKSISFFIKTSTSYFVKQYNVRYSRKGTLLLKPFGIASKYGDKRIRTAISYLYNNPVEKKIVQKAEDYRWSFIGYSMSNYPFSKKLVKRNCTYGMRSVLKLFDYYRKSGVIINYAMISGIIKNLNPKECEQMVDYIISSTCDFDFKSCENLYKDFDNMMTAINANTGSEYDIVEDKDPYSDYPYQKMVETIESFVGSIEKIAFKSRTAEQTRALTILLRRETTCEMHHVRRLLHMP